MLLRSGDDFGRYRLLAELGRGGMGVVLRARDTLLVRDVALKLVAPGQSGNAASAWSLARSSAATSDALLREARAAAAINHPNAVSVFDVGEVEGVPYIAMELIEGRTLRHFIASDPPALRVRIAWLADIARALAAAHARGLVHRDVKPENVMIRDDGTPKMLDFGICMPMAAGAAVPEVETPRLTGTPRYMAPEQLRGEPADARADQFSWGVVAHELLCGALPWAAHAQGVDTLLRVRSRAPYALQAWNPDIDPALDAIVRRALAPRAEERFADMHELATALQARDHAGELARVIAPRPVRRGAIFASVCGVLMLSGSAVVAPDRVGSATQLAPPSASEPIAAPASEPEVAAAAAPRIVRRVARRKPKARLTAAPPSDPLADPN